MVGKCAPWKSQTEVSLWHLGERRGHPCSRFLRLSSGACDGSYPYCQFQAPEQSPAAASITHCLLRLERTERAIAAHSVSAGVPSLSARCDSRPVAVLLTCLDGFPQVPSPAERAAQPSCWLLNVTQPGRRRGCSHSEETEEPYKLRSF